MKSHIMRAEWNNILMANFIAPKELLLPLVPHHTELDLFNANAYISLVGFMFLNTTMHGFSIPLHTDFEEVNLRFYVKYNSMGNWKRGVVFIKEIVPKPAVAFIANTFFEQKYSTMKMRHTSNDAGKFIEAGYEWNYENKWNKLAVKATKKSFRINDGSYEEFIADNYWGYTKSSESKTYEYEVQHPRWELQRVDSHSIQCDFGALYGEEFSFLSKEKPESVLFTKGSEIKIFGKKLL